MRARDTLARTLFEDQHHQFRDAVRRFFAAELTPNIARWEAQGQVDKSFWRVCGEQGALCPDMPEAYGGAGLDFRANAIVLEETSYTCAATPVMAAPMFIVSSPALVIAQCQAGMVGSMLAPNAHGVGAVTDSVPAATRVARLMSEYQAARLAFGLR